MLKSTSAKSSLKSTWAHQRGLECEAKVIRHYQRKGYHLLRQRLKTPYAEIDLIFRTPEGNLLMVEVKSARTEVFIAYRLSKRQKLRQHQALIFLAEHFKTSVEAHWAFVMDSGEIVVIEDISGC